MGKGCGVGGRRWRGAGSWAEVGWGGLAGVDGVEVLCVRDEAVDLSGVEMSDGGSAQNELISSMAWKKEVSMTSAGMKGWATSGGGRGMVGEGVGSCRKAVGSARSSSIGWSRGTAE